MFEFHFARSMFGTEYIINYLKHLRVENINICTSNMINYVLSLDKNFLRVFHDVWKSIESINFQYLIIWLGLMIVAITIIIFTRIQESSNRQISRIRAVSKDEMTVIEEEEKPTITLNNNNVMIDHLKMLRELHDASERCYKIENAAKCIKIISYCPHLVNVRNKLSGMTPFHNACYHGHECLVEYMLAKGANPWLTTNNGETALCLAIQACIKCPDKSLKCLEHLQKYGCYLDHMNKWYRIYLEAALFTRNQPLTRWMFDQASRLGKRCASFPPTRI